MKTGKKGTVCIDRVNSLLIDFPLVNESQKSGRLYLSVVTSLRPNQLLSIVKKKKEEDENSKIKKLFLKCHLKDVIMQNFLNELMAVYVALKLEPICFIT